MKPAGIAVLGLLALAAVILLALFAGGGPATFGAGLPAGAEPVTVAYSPFESTALLWIAEDQGYFARNGLNVTLREYDSGSESLNAVVNGDADITVGVTEFPLVAKALQNTSVQVMGIIDRGSFIYLVGRKDRIGTPADLKGKRIGTTKGTVAEFHLGRYLTLHGMSIDDITLVDVRTPDGWVHDVADGKIDAISTAQPYVNRAQALLGSNGFAWPEQSSQPLYGLVVSTDEWLAAHPDQAKRFLRSFAQAEEYLYAHPAESRAIVEHRLGLDYGYMDTAWEENQYALTLDQSLILAMEDEARWMIANNLTNKTTVPDFRKYIYTDGMESVRPGSVNIIR